VNDLYRTLGVDQYLSPFAWFALLLSAYGLPLGWLAWRRCIYPTGLLLAGFLLPAVISWLLLATTAFYLPILLVDLVLVLLAGFDLLTLPRNGQLTAERETSRTASLRKPQQVTLTVNNPTRRHFEVTLRDGLPEELIGAPDEFELDLAPQSRVSVEYRLESTRRGAFQLHELHLRARSRWKLWNRLLQLPVRTELHVYPDMQQLSEYALLARTNRLSLMGLRRTRKIGQDNEFERLRDYSPDDNYKHIDWRATSRRSKLTVKDYQSNQSQRLLFMLDCGRMMTNEAAGLSLLDHGLNAMLMLSYVALSHGDSVGLLCFSDEIHRFVPPKSGMQQMNRLLHAAYDRFPRLVESRYDLAFMHLAQQVHKRSLVVLVTNVIDEVNSHQIERYLTAAANRHLTLGVLLRDRAVFEAAESEYPNDILLYRAAAAADILTWRAQVLADLHHRGVLSLDVFPEDLTAPLVNRYLEIKARHLL
jgi:uncharacterized protein (DUF58 family)